MRGCSNNWTRLIGVPMGMFDPYGNVLLGSGWYSDSKQQINAFKQVIGHPNNRPVQPKNTRVVLK
jgi:hypothetical protein